MAVAAAERPASDKGGDVKSSSMSDVEDRAKEQDER